MPATNTAPQVAELDFTALLERAGFEVRGKRANCPYCTGHSRLTVAITRNEVAFCHRCHWTGNLRTLSRELKLPVPRQSEEQRRERETQTAFDIWVHECEGILLDHLRHLQRDARWAQVALCYPETQVIAWETLAQVYDQMPGILASLEFLSCEKVPAYLEQPITRAELYRAFSEAQRVWLP